MKLMQFSYITLGLAVRLKNQRMLKKKRQHSDLFSTMSSSKLNKRLEIAVGRRNLEAVKALLSAGANVNHRRKCDGGTMLQYSDSVEIAEELLLRGAYINADNKWKESALHIAITEGKGLEMVRLLLEYGALVDYRDGQGYTPLSYAVKISEQNPEIIVELLKHGADINARIHWGRRGWISYVTPLDFAIDEPTYAKLLIKYTLLKDFPECYKRTINLDTYQDRENYRVVLNYLDECVAEIVQMKKHHQRLYKFLKKETRIPCGNAFSVRLAKVDNFEQYPIYNDLILDEIKPLKERAALLYKSSKIQVYTKLKHDGKEKKIILDHDSTYYITEYLSNEDLLNFLEAFDESSKITQTSNNLENPDSRINEASICNDPKRIRLQ